MSAKPTKKAPAPLALFAIYAGGLAAIFLVIALMLSVFDVTPARKRFKAPDDVKVARELLAEKLTGPRYFHFGQGADSPPRPFINVIEARRQIDGIIKTRQWPPEMVGKIEQLIDKLTEPASSRMLGVDRVNVLQLNLALDDLP